MNNPLKYTDCSGYSWFKKKWKQIVTSVVALVVTATSGLASGWVGAISDTLSRSMGATSAALNDGNSSSILKSATLGALVGATAGSFYTAGSVSAVINNQALRYASKTVLGVFGGGGGLRSVVTGAKFGLGFASSAFVAMSSPYRRYCQR